MLNVLSRFSGYIQGPEMRGQRPDPCYPCEKGGAGFGRVVTPAGKGCNAELSVSVYCVFSKGLVFLGLRGHRCVSLSPLFLE